MSRNRDFREPRRRGFDDDFAAPPRSSFGGGDRPFSSPSSSFSAPAPSGPPIDATVKWFNPEKGFGFVELSDGSGDVFLHARALEAAGQESVPPGSKLSVRVGQGQKGRQVTEVLEVDTSTAEAAPPRRERTGGFGGAPRSGGFGAGAGAGPRAASGPTEERVGTVKWYNPDKGFGFIAVEGGGKDVFVHVTVVSRSGLADLAEGQRVVVQVGQGPKGPEARGIEVAD
ncbi:MULTISPECIES: cold-shock protein [Roseixanthobacter]|uniref:cold-shock protein n=1 Tax=Xanthobacteraceae TaxID=335928 RepID=UPI000BDC658E|nr:MAG: cold-shock protein [Rhizobiales bacterium 35-66-30]OYZ69004.1 MAG: cold-shock protein [Rhizobiales bacterium 24-66-13]OZB02598.1 MAG: cold-shock protein [Rhizobiales bacterium 39-66-18]HQS10150.1 cold-shock protein [Xanthobacteraceae bacterium]HQS46835.1 cold-shock protein [Xanthobacteraceae bacterium]